MTINHRRISVSIASGLILEVINKISPIIILHHAQKQLGTADFGYAQYRIAVLESIQPFICFGFNNFILNEPGIKSSIPSAMRAVFSDVFWIKLINGLLVSAVLFWTFDGDQSGETSFSLVLVYAWVILACVIESQWYALTRRKYVLMNMIMGILRLAALVAIVGFVRGKGDRDLFVLLSIAPNASMALFTGWLALKDFKISKFVSKEIARVFIKSMPYTFVLIMTTLLDRTDMFIVKNWFGLEATGSYAGPAKIIQSIGLLLLGLAVPLYVEMLNLTDKSSLRKHISISVWLNAALVAPLVFGVPFVERDILNIVFTDLPTAANHLLSTLSIGLLGSVFVIVYGMQLQMSKSRTWPIVLGSIAAMLATVSVSWLLRERFQLLGVAYGMVVGKFIFGLICCYTSRDLVDGFPWRAIVSPLAAGALMALILKLVNSENLYMNMGIGAIIYMAAIAALSWGELKLVLRRD